MTTPTRAESLPDLSAEDRLIPSPVEAPRDNAPTSGQMVCRRQTGRQATSAVALRAVCTDASTPRMCHD